jgi:urocanate hydratase
MEISIKNLNNKKQLLSASQKPVNFIVAAKNTANSIIKNTYLFTQINIEKKTHWH